MTRLLLLGVLSLGMTCIAVGQNGQGQDGNGQGQDGNNQGGGAPEIDPSQAVSAIALLGGTTLVIRGRQKK